MKQSELFNDLNRQGAFNYFNSDTLSDILNSKCVIINSIILKNNENNIWEILPSNNIKSSYLKLNESIKIFNLKNYNVYSQYIIDMVIRDNSQEYTHFTYDMSEDGWVYIKLTNLPEEITSTVDIAITYHIFIPED